ncbi:dynein heavy chain family protein [Holotrichia oblita]|uniref:Dynein heavy chain family protein n=1 Tax=Holotrichia oblita TaxID=644536 RepID=A0ACB9TRB0_HOLOL|nr:dynein heavy chain family protein [Holotrichia oblita]
MHVRERTVSCSTGRTRRRDEVQGEDGRGHGAAERSERRTDPMDGAIGSVQVGDGTAGRRRAHHDRLPGLYGAVQSGVQNVARGQLGEPADREEDTVHVELERDGMPNGHGDDPKDSQRYIPRCDKRIKTCLLRYRNHIEDSVSLGYPMIIEDINEELDPVLDNVLEKNHIKIGSTYKVKIGDKEVDVHKDFRLYITTKLANPSYTPEVFARTSIIDFTVTMKGLEDQLLGRVILTEKKELESERTNLIKDVTENKRKMLELEQSLLYKLTTIQGSLLDDETLISVLNVSKDTAAEVREKLAIAKDTEIKINAAREEFRYI